MDGARLEILIADDNDKTLGQREISCACPTSNMLPTAITTKYMHIVIEVKWKKPLYIEPLFLWERKLMLFEIQKLAVYTQAHQ